MNCWKPLIRVLLYPVQFEPDPLAAVERVLAQLRARPDPGRSPEALLEAVRLALASEASLASLLPQGHPEPVVRGYLAEVARRLSAPASPT